MTTIQVLNDRDGRRGRGAAWLRSSVAAIVFAALAAPAIMPPAASAQEQAAPAESQARAPAISTVTVAREEIAETTLVTGTLVPREEVIVGVDVEGFKVVELLAEEGDRVKKGDVLARLDTATVGIQLAQNASQLARADAAIAQARASIAQAEAAKVEADAALVRTRDLAERGVSAQEVLDQRVSAAASAAAQLNSARQGLELAIADRALTEAQRREIELTLAKTEIKAPADGLVLGRAALVGAVATPGEPLFRLAEGGLIELQADVTETNLAALEPGMAVSVTPAGFIEPVAGEIRLISPEVDATSRLGEVRVALDAEALLRVGSYARGTVEIARSTGVTVPLSALVMDGRQASVQAVVDGRIETRPVETGLRTAETIEITEGLAEGDVVVRRAGSFVRDGDEVTAVAFAEEGR